MIAFLNLRTYLGFVNPIAALSKFFFTVAELWKCHGFDLALTLPLHSNLREYLPKKTDTLLNKARRFSRSGYSTYSKPHNTATSNEYDAQVTTLEIEM